MEPEVRQAVIRLAPLAAKKGDQMALTIVAGEPAQIPSQSTSANGLAAVAGGYSKAAVTHTVVGLVMLGLGVVVEHVTEVEPPVSAPHVVTDACREHADATLCAYLRIAIAQPAGSSREGLLTTLVTARDLASPERQISTQTILCIVELAGPH